MLMLMQVVQKQTAEESSYKAVQHISEQGLGFRV